MPAQLNPQRRRTRRALQEAEQASATGWSDECASSPSVLDGSSSRSSELGTLEASAASSSTSSKASDENCDPCFPNKEGAFEPSALQSVEAGDHLLQRIRSLEDENELLKAKKDMIAYRLIDTQDQLERCQEQHNVLEHERDEARSCADAWWTEAKEQEDRANAAQEYAEKVYQNACQAHSYACAIENELWGTRNDNNALAYYLSQKRILNANLQNALYQRDQLIAFGQGMVQGMLQGQHALQSEVQALQNDNTTLTEENTLLRFIAGLPPKCCPCSDIIPASSVQCPAGARPRPKVCFPRQQIGSSLRHAPSTPCCVEEMATSVCEPRPHHTKTTADDPCAAPSSVLLIADCTRSHKPSPKKAQGLSNKPAESTAEQVLREWVEQPQHFTVRQLQHDLAPEHKVAQSYAAAKKSSIGGLIGSTLGALFGLGQRKAPLVT